MKDLDKQRIQKLAEDLMFRLSDAEVDDIYRNGLIFRKQLDVINFIDTQGVEAMSYPLAMETHWLREDVVNHQLDQQDAFKNAPHVEGDYFSIVKVVKK